MTRYTPARFIDEIDSQGFSLFITLTATMLRRNPMIFPKLQQSGAGASMITEMDFSNENGEHWSAVILFSLNSMGMVNGHIISLLRWSEKKELKLHFECVTALTGVGGTMNYDKENDSLYFKLSSHRCN